MTWTRPKKVVALIVVVVFIVPLIWHFPDISGARRSQTLPDGTTLTVTRAVFANKVSLVHGPMLSRLLGDVIPKKGVKLFGLQLNRPTKRTLGPAEHSFLLVEFRLSGANATNSAFVKSRFFRQFRYVIYGDAGTEFVHEQMYDQSGNENFSVYPDGIFGYVYSDVFPRDSRRLGIRVEERQSQSAGGPWQLVADFKIKNPAPTVAQKWSATPVPITNSTNSLELILQDLTFRNIPYMTNDIWNQVLRWQMEVRSNGILFTNWSPVYVRGEDAIGNRTLLFGHRGLDPRFVWKLETDFQPVTNFSPDELFTIEVPMKLSTPIVTNIAGVDTTIRWANGRLFAEFPDSRTDKAMRLVDVRNLQGEDINDFTGSWNWNMFMRSLKLDKAKDHIKATIAIVPNVRTTFYVKPNWLRGTNASSTK